MITKGLIQSIDFSSNTCMVRLPFFETAGNPTEMTLQATFAITPGIFNSYKVGDVVQVAFENGEINNPVVVGKLFLGGQKESVEPRGSATFNSLEVAQSATLPLDTKFKLNIGDTTIPNVKGSYRSYESVQDIINNMQDLNKQIVTQQAQNESVYLVKDGSNLSQGFGWKLTDKYWALISYDDNRDPITIFKADNSGVSIAGDLKLEDYPNETLYRFKQIDVTTLTDKDFFTVTVPGEPTEDGGEGEPKEYKYLRYPAFLAADGTEITDYNKLTLDDIENERNGWKTIEEFQTDASNYQDKPAYKNGYLTWQIAYTTTYSLDGTELVASLLKKSVSIGLLDNGGSGYLTQSGLADASNKTNDDLKNTQEDLKGTQEDLKNTQEDLKSTQEDLEGTQEDLEGTKDRVDIVEVVAQGKSTNYYSKEDPATKKNEDGTALKYLIKDGDCWFDTNPQYIVDGVFVKDGVDNTIYIKDIEDRPTYYYILPAAPEDTPEYAAITADNISTIADGTTIYTRLEGTLKQWVGEPNTAEAGIRGKWEDIGGELVANKVTATYINALDITAKKITVTDGKEGDNIVFRADGLTDSPDKVEIAGFKVSRASIKKGEIGTTGSVLVSTGETSTANIAGSSPDGTTSNTWAFTAQDKFGVTTDGTLYTVAAKINDATINDATINSKIEVKNGDNIIFLADASSESDSEETPEEPEKPKVQIAGFTVNETSIKSGTIGGESSVLISTGESSNASIANSIGTNTWAFVAGNKFGVTTDGTLYTKSAVINNSTISSATINNATINSKLEVKDENNTTLFLADASTDTVDNDKKVQIGDFKVTTLGDTSNRYRSLVITDTNNITQLYSSTEITAGELVIQSKKLSTLSQSQDISTEYYAGISGKKVALPGGATITYGLFGNNINRLFPKVNTATSTSMWNTNNLFNFPVPGCFTFYDRTEEDLFYSGSTKKLSETYTEIESRQPNLIFTANLNLIWPTSEGTPGFIIFDLRKSSYFSQFNAILNNGNWSGAYVGHPVILGAQLTPIDGAWERMGIYLPGDGTPNMWTGNGKADIVPGQIGLVIEANNSMKASSTVDSYYRKASLIVFLYYPSCGAANIG